MRVTLASLKFLEWETPTKAQIMLPWQQTVLTVKKEVFAPLFHNFYHKENLKTNYYFK